jgi:3-oxoacyl-[acyl-carrier protein] reductase
MVAGGDALSLAGRTAVVTGASRGIGRAVAVELARGGARVFCVSTAEGGCEATVAACAEVGGQATGLVADVADASSVERLAQRVLADTPRLDVLVNNAGIARDGLFVRMSDDDFDRVIAVNLKGAFLVARAFARTMTKARYGRIINVSSVVGIGGNVGQANYAASKAGLIGMSKALAKELGSRGITVNVIAPGFIETDMTAELTAEVKQASLARISLARFGTPADVAGAVRFLASDAAAYITGQVLVVDGGLLV